MLNARFAKKSCRLECFTPILASALILLLACRSTSGPHSEAGIILTPMSPPSVSAKDASSTIGESHLEDASSTIGESHVEPSAPPPRELLFFGAAHSRIFTISVDRETGAGAIRSISEVPGGVLQLGLSGNKRFLYALGSRVTAFSIDPLSAALARINESDVKFEAPSSLVVARSSRWLLAAGVTQGIFLLSLDQTGAVSARPPMFFTGASVGHIASDVAGDFLLVPLFDENNILRFQLDPESSSVPSVVGRSQLNAGSGPSEIVFHPSNRYAYSVNSNDTITSFSYTAGSGELSSPETVSFLPPGETLTSGVYLKFRGVAFHPSGKFLFLTDNGNGGRVISLVANENGRLAWGGVTGNPKGYVFRAPDALALDPTGTFLLVGNSAAGVQIFRVHPITGELSFLNAIGAQSVRSFTVFSGAETK